MSIINQVIQLAVQIQQIPAPSFNEGQRTKFIHEKFEMENLKDLEVDSTGNVLGRLPGNGTGQPLVVSAHSDTVFPFETDLRLTQKEDRIYGPGIGDNSLGVAGLFGLLWLLRKQEVILPGDLWFAANVCEEGLGDLRGIRAIVDRLNDEPLAYIVVEGMALGQIYHRGLGVQRYQINAKAPGGHSWVDFGTPSAVHELANLITRITAIELPDSPRTTTNVGVISGGTSVNTIAAGATLQLDLRSTDPQTLNELANQVERMVKGSSKPNLDFQAEIIGQRPAGEISSKHPLVKVAADILKELGVKPTLNIGSTDANIPLSRGLPSVCVGLTTGGGAHTTHEFIHTKPIEIGLNQLFRLTQEVFKKLS